MLVSALDESGLVDLGGALGHQPGDHQRRARAQVGGGDGRAVQVAHALDDGGLLHDAHLRAHALDLVQVLEAVFKNGFHHDAVAAGAGEHGAHGLLKVCGEARVFLGFQVHGPVRALAAHADGIVGIGHLYAHLEELGGQRFHVRGNAAVDHHVAVRGRGGDHQRAGLDLIGDYAVAAAVHIVHAADADGVGARAAYAPAHGVQEVGQVYDMRLARGVMYGGVAVGAGGGEHQVDGTAHSDAVKEDIGAHQRAVGVYHAAVIVHLRAQGAEALYVLLEGAVADGAAAGIAHLALAEAAEQRAPQVIACAHALGVLEGHVEGSDRPGIHRHAAVGGIVIHPRAQQHEHVAHHMHVLDIGQVFHRAGLVAQQDGRQYGHRGVLAPVHAGFAPQRVPARDQQLIAVHAVSFQHKIHTQTGIRKVHLFAV